MKTLKQTSAIVLSIFVFIASINIVINQHFCNDDLESIAFFIKAQPCEHASPKSDLPPCHSQKVADQKKCCSEKQVVVKSVDWLKIISDHSSFEFSIKNPLQLEFPEHRFTEDNPSEFSLQKVPKPPDEFSTIFIEHQAFLL